MRNFQKTVLAAVAVLFLSACSGVGGRRIAVRRQGWTEERGLIDSRINSHLENRRYTEALALIDSAAARGYEDPRIMGQKAYSLGMTGRGEESVRLFEKAILADYANCWNHHSFALVLMRIDMTGRAITEFREAKRFCGGDALTAVNRDMAVAYLKLGNEKKAYEEVIEGLQRAPLERYLIGLRAVLAARRDPAGADSLLATVSGMEDLDPGFYEELGAILFETGNTASAVKALSQARAISPDDRDITYKLAVALKAGGRESDAEKLLLEGGVDGDPRFQELLADILFDTGRYNEALEIYGSLPVTEKTLDRMAMSHKELGHLDKALDLELNALKMRPDWPTGLINMAVIRGARGELDEAIAALRKVLEIDPDNSVAKENIRRIEEARGGGR